jgi:hypothetical protein
MSARGVDDVRDVANTGLADSQGKSRTALASVVAAVALVVLLLGTGLNAGSLGQGGPNRL